MSNIGVGNVLDTSLRIYRENFSKFAALGAIITVPATLFFVPMLFGYASQFMSLTSGGQTAVEMFEDSSVGFGLMAFAATVVTYLLSLLAMTAASDLTHSALRDEIPSVERSIERAGSALAASFGATFLAGLLIGLGSFLCVIPGIILTCCYMLVIPAVITEDAGPIEALKRSRQVTKGSRWAVFGTMVVATLILSIVMGLGQTLTLWLIRLMIPAGSNPTASALILPALCLLAFYTLLTPFAWIPPTVMFDWLRDNKEGTDLERRVDKLAETSPYQYTPTR